MQKENKVPTETYQYVGPYRLEKTLGKGQTGEFIRQTSFNLLMNGFELFIVCKIWLIPRTIISNERLTSLNPAITPIIC